MMTEKPVVKYPVDYKCTHIYDIVDRLKEKGIEVCNLCPGVKTKNKSHDFNLYNFIGDKVQKENTIYPKIRLIDVTDRKYNYESITDKASVILLPAHYDSSNDEEISKKKKEDSRNNLIELFKKSYSGNQLDDMITKIDKNVNFGPTNYEWANNALDIIYEEYKEYYTNGYLRVWYPSDLDTGTYFGENQDENTSHGYPIEKTLFLSDIEKYLETNYGLKDDLFYQFIVDNTYIEGRHWDRVIGLYFDENLKFNRDGGKYGMDATPTIDKMLGVLEFEYSDMIKNVKDGYECIYIYTDYYKNINFGINKK